MSDDIRAGDVEEWRDVVVGDRIVQVSSHGRVKTFGRLRKIGLSPNGYPVVGIAYAKGRQKTMAVHPLIMLAFHGPCPDGMERAHLDGNRANNRADNLAYVTHRENMGHQWAHGTRVTGERAGPDVLSWDKVHDIRAAYNEGASVHFLSRKFGVSRRTITNVAQGLHWRLEPKTKTELSERIRACRPVKEREPA